MVREVLGPLLADPALPKIGHDLKYSEVLLHRNGMDLAGAELDTMLASYLLDPEAENTLEALADRDAGVKVPPLDGGAPKKRGQPARAFDELDVAVAGTHAARLAEITLGLADRYAPRLRDAKLDGLLRDLELPLSHILAGMEETGVLVDPKALDVLGKEMAKELATLEEKARAAAGQDFNLGSRSSSRRSSSTSSASRRRRRPRPAAPPTPRCWSLSPTTTRSPPSCSSTAPSPSSRAPTSTRSRA